MPVSEEYKLIPITENGIRDMPKPMARRMRVALTQPEVEGEFFEFVKDMGYEPHMASAVLRQMLFEAFIGGWGAKTRQIKRRKKERAE